MTRSDVGRALVAEIPRTLGASARLVASIAIAAAKAALASARALETIAQHIEG